MRLWLILASLVVLDLGLLWLMVWPDLAARRRRRRRGGDLPETLFRRLR